MKVALMLLMLLALALSTLNAAAVEAESSSSSSAVASDADSSASSYATSDAMGSNVSPEGPITEVSTSQGTSISGDATASAEASGQATASDTGTATAGASSQATASDTSTASVGASSQVTTSNTEAASAGASGQAIISNPLSDIGLATHPEAALSNVLFFSENASSIKNMTKQMVAKGWTYKSFRANTGNPIIDFGARTIFIMLVPISEKWDAFLFL